MNTHADNMQENKSRSVANGIAQIQSAGESSFQFVDNRPDAIAQRKLQELANNRPQAKQVAQLQASILQRVVGQKPGEYFCPNLAWAKWFAAMTPEELSVELDKLGLNLDSTAVARMNEVLIRNKLQPLTDALPEQEVEQGLNIGEKKETKAKEQQEAEQDGSSQKLASGKGAEVSGKVAEISDEPAIKLIKRKKPEKLKITAGDKKKLVLEVLNEFGEVIASIIANEGNTKAITAKLIGKKTSVKNSYPITAKELHPEFKNSFTAFCKLVDAESHLEQLKQAGNLKANLPSQKELYDHLFKAMQAAKGKGHASVKMAKIPLITAIKYSAYGKEHMVTHLYTQPGNETEIRCYLGTDNGPFQRIHTSLTVKPNETSTAHTMVQTGPELGIPPFAATTGERVGFDSKETEKGMGFEHRLLTERSKMQCTVKGYIEGKTLEEIGVDNAKVAKDMAVSFNQTLDQVSKDISNGDLDKRGVTWLSSFNPIDEAK